MPTPVTSDEVEDQTDATDHLDAAKSFFGEEPVAQKPAVKQDPEPVVTKTPSRLASIIKQPEKAVVPPPAASTKPEDLTKDIDAINDPAETSKTYADWKTLKTISKEARLKAHEYEQKLQGLQKELEETRAKMIDPNVDASIKARNAELEEQNKRFSDRLKVLDAKSHPDFEKQYLAPQRQAKAAIEQLLKDEEIADVNLEALAALKGKKFNEAASEILEKLTPISQAKFVKALDSFLDARNGAEQALANADKFIEAKTAEQLARSRHFFDAAGKKFQGFFVPQAIDEKASPEAKQEAEAYNAAVANIAKAAEDYGFGKVSEEQAAELPHKAALLDHFVAHGLPRIQKLYEAEISSRDQKIAELESQVSKLTVVKPTVSAGAGAHTGKDIPPEDEDHLTAARRAFTANV